jgi:hypothetical protein
LNDQLNAVLERLPSIDPAAIPLPSVITNAIHVKQPSMAAQTLESFYCGRIYTISQLLLNFLK